MKWINDPNSPTGESLVSNNEASTISTKFNLKKLKKESAALYKAASDLVIKHNPNADLNLEIHKRIRQGFANDLQFLIDNHLISLLVS